MQRTTTYRSSGLNSADLNQFRWPVNVIRNFCLCTSQICMHKWTGGVSVWKFTTIKYGRSKWVPSWAWHLNCCIHARLANSIKSKWTLMVLSSEPVSKNCPSWLNPIVRTAPPWALITVDLASLQKNHCTKLLIIKNPSTTLNLLLQTSFFTNSNMLIYIPTCWSLCLENSCM
jgi:hypothetical protein